MFRLKALHQHEGAALCRGLNRWELCVRATQGRWKVERPKEGASNEKKGPRLCGDYNKPNQNGSLL